MAAKPITEEYVVDLCRRIGEGETPQKDTEMSAKVFTRRMLPHLKSFLDNGYTYKEIAAFFGHVSVAELKKAAAKASLKKAAPKANLEKAAAGDVPENKTEKKADTKEPAKAVCPEAPVKPAAKDAQTNKV